MYYYYLSNFSKTVFPAEKKNVDKLSARIEHNATKNLLLNKFSNNVFPI
jgi:hypothetical protein